MVGKGDVNHVMDKFVRCEVGVGGRVTGVNEEVTHGVFSQSVLSVGDLGRNNSGSKKKSGGNQESSNGVRGSLNITSHRIIMYSDDTPSAYILPMELVTKVLDESSLMKGRILVYPRGSHDKAVQIELNRRRDVARALESLGKSIRERVWMKQREHQKKAAQSTVNETQQLFTRNAVQAQSTVGSNAPPQIGTVGVDALFRREKQREEVRTETLTSAFQDLDSLMERAREVVSISETIQASLDRKRRETEAQQSDKNASTNSSSALAAQEDELSKLLSEMGISSPVTMNTVGKRKSVYHEQIAYQLAQFLPPLLDKLGGIVTAVDAFCMYNRARASTELVGPDDFRAAYRLFEPLKIPLLIIRLESSGITAIRNAHSNVEAAAERLRELAVQKGSLVALDLIQTNSMPLSLAVEQLETAEQLGKLCRDETPEHGVRFYPNKFSEFSIKTR
uniref:Vacuolar protein-sorting-associated protein 36 n=1 Tax=Timspurckia oligopyrenoides TaxID=708627 RepID=A0A7S0ZHW5_9RHOD|mmetsp:Transcript_5983/g.10636  ORF Transcript_5983/g.10636 Transcript_5983/m.10636 type:complete len:450 (+) Transcript_5983:1379-2728(+)